MLSRRGYLAEGSRRRRGRDVETLRGNESRRRRGRDVDTPWKRVATTPRPRRGNSPWKRVATTPQPGRGHSVETGARLRFTEVATLLVDNGAQMDIGNTDGASPLWIACQNGHTDAARLLLGRGTTIRAVIVNGLGEESTSRRRRGDDAAIPRKSRGGAAATTCRRGYDVNFGHHAGADVEKSLQDGATPLYIACQHGHVGPATLCLERGDAAYVDKPRTDGATPLFIACELGRVDAVRLLLAHGADVARPRQDGSTPLRVAQRRGSGDQIAALCRRALEPGESKSTL